MSDERCFPYRENLAAYALGVLDADEIRALETHLKGCQDCQAELADYQSVAAGLLQVVPPQTPPPDVRRKLVAQLPSQRAHPNLFTNIFARFSIGQIAIAVVVVILLGLNIFSSVQIRNLKRQQSALAERLSNDQTALSMLAYPSTQSLVVNPDIQNLAGSMLVDKEKRIAVLVLWNLPPLEAGQTYQAWLIDADGNRVSGGLFLPDGQRYTTITVRAPVPIGEFDGFGVTVEPEGGSEGPTGPRVLAVDL
ncbi:MAG: anti-sigma factor [Anaerolineales bacterium]|jgi:anti-sigma-K factor RskA